MRARSVSVASGYDPQSNNTNCLVIANTTTDLSITRQMDPLNRIQSIWANYFNVPNSSVATYAYFGPGRVQTKTLGNGARISAAFDVKRRLSSLVSYSPSNAILVGFEYGYDNVDNPPPGAGS
jgi:hypothetical protein